MTNTDANPPDPLEQDSSMRGATNLLADAKEQKANPDAKSNGAALLFGAALLLLAGSAAVSSRGGKIARRGGKKKKIGKGKTMMPM
jgi:hypothetical protein